MLSHNSWNPEDRYPFGAVSCGETVRLRLRGGNPGSRMRVFEPGREYLVSPEAVEENSAVFFLTAMDQPGLCYYTFYSEEGMCCGPARPGQGGESVYGGNPHGWQLTVVKPNRTPEWLADGVGLQIYVDRFFNPLGEGRILHAKPGDILHANWEDTPFYIRDEDGSVLRWDFFGGNLEGVIRKLPLFAERGVTVIYLNPIFEAASNHKYDTADYLKIDPAYGDEADLRRLCETAHGLGMRVILDGVFSHTGSISRYFNADGRYEDVGAAQSTDSPYASWYRFKKFPDAYECWWGVLNMPCTEEMDPSFLSFIVTGEDSVIRHWMRCGVDGWRLDVADELPSAFLKELRRVVREENPEAILLGEVWEDASNKISYGEKRAYLMGEELDSVTNYPLRNGLLNFLLGKSDADTLRRRLYTLAENYPRDIFYSLMNMTGSHDTRRLLSVLGEAPDPSLLTERKREIFRLTAEQRKLGLERLVLYAVLLFTHPGLPMVYYGDDAGMEGYADPYNRGPYPWGREEYGLPEIFTRLALLRRDHPVLRRGDFLPIAPAPGAYGVLRTGGGRQCLALANRENAQVSLSLSAEWAGAASLFGSVLPDAEGHIRLPPREAVILLLEKEENAPSRGE